MDRIIKTLIIDDSILFRYSLTKRLSLNNKIRIVDTAADAFEAREMIIKYRPTVIVLDVRMPKLNGIDFLKMLLPQYPVATIVVTGYETDAFLALDAGAVDFMKKPSTVNDNFNEFADKLAEKVIVAADANVSAGKNVLLGNERKKHYKEKIDIIAIGASTGGPEALINVVQNLPENTPPVVIVQHMPAGFTKTYADRLNKICKMDVVESKNGIRLRNGLIVIAAGEHQVRVKKDKLGFYITSGKEGKVNGHAPSVDVLFKSVAKCTRKNAIGVILTGMGGDGSKGLLEMRVNGAYTIGQDEETCVVYGMPKVAYDCGAVRTQLPIWQIEHLINKIIFNDKGE